MGLAQAASPGSLQELAVLVDGFNGDISYIAGGTDYIVELEHDSQPGLIIDLSSMDELNFIDMDSESVCIGAATPLSALVEQCELVATLPVLTQAAMQMGSVQIRNRATIGGNIASAVPGGDLLPVLKCLECQVEVLRRDSTVSSHSFEEVVTGLGKTCLGNGDMIKSIKIPLPYGRNRISAFGKIGRRRELTIARLNLALIADYEPVANRIDDIRIVAGAIGPVPLRLQSVEQKLRGRKINQAFTDDFLHALATAVDTAIPGRVSRCYKRHAILGLGLDLMQSLFGKSFSFSKQSKSPA